MNIKYLSLPQETEVVAQLVRALVCGTRGRGFETHLPPQEKEIACGFLFFIYNSGIFLPQSIHT